MIPVNFVDIRTVDKCCCASENYSRLYIPVTSHDVLREWF